MYPKVLTKEQEDLLPLIKAFSNEFGLVGGTAIALQIGHRKSIDFDLFKKGAFDILKINKNINTFFPIEQVLVENPDEYTIKVNRVQLTFYNYPFELKYNIRFDQIISMSDLLTIAAMKAFALGKRAKWKDYVDLYFIFQQYSLKEVVANANEIFKNQFSEKLFREQLSYHQDIDYTEEIVYMAGYKIDNNRIRQALTKISTS